MRNVRALFVLPAILLLAGCPDDTPPSQTTDMMADVDAAPDDMMPDVMPDMSDDMATDMTMKDLCDPNPCTEENRGVCEVRGQTVVCKCDVGFEDDGGVCVPDAVCGPEACTEPNRSQCEDVDGTAVCSCDAGWVDQGGTCVLENPCASQPCTEPNRGQCSVGANNTAVCSCDAGFRDDAGACVPVDPCDMNPCQEANKSVCTNEMGTAQCSCDPGFRDDGGSCVPQDPCDPNPCTMPNRGQCAPDANGTNAVCSCDTGYEEDAQGACVVIPPPMCNNQHTTGDMYEPDECVTLATPIATGTSQSHTLEPAGDYDFYELSPMAGEILVMEETTNTDIRFTLYDADGQTVLKQTDSETLRWEFPTVGPYYLSVRHYRSSSTGPYSLSVSSLGLDDHGDASADATSLNINASVSGAVEVPGDRDFFSFTAQAGSIYEFRETTNADVYFELYDTDGQTVLKRTDSETWRWEFADAGTYTFHIRQYSTSRVGPYDFTITDLGFDDHGDTTMASSMAAAGTPIMGDIEVPGDRDVFALTVQAGSIYEIRETTNADMYFSLFDTDGQTALRRTDSETWRWEFDAAGTYYLEVRRYSSSHIGSYNVVITDLGFDDHGDDIMNATAVTPGQMTMGQVETRGDRDVFSFTAQAGHIYRLEESSAFDAYMTLRDDQGNILRAHSSDWMQWEFVTGGTYYLELRHYSSSSIGAYTFSITDLGMDDAGDSTMFAAASMPMVSGNLETYRDVDVYSFDVSQSDQIFYIAETSSTDVTLTLYDTDGQTVLKTQTSPEWIARQFDTPGTYFVSVRHSSATRIGTYDLVFEDRGLDDHGNGPALATSIMADGMNRQGSLEYRGDTDWFSFTTTAGNVYAIKIAGSSQFRATLYAADGATEIDSATNTTMFPTLNANTTYFVEVETRSTNTIGDYTLSVDD